jgi:hypothetical protein
LIKFRRCRYFKNHLEVKHEFKIDGPGQLRGNPSQPKDM